MIQVTLLVILECAVICLHPFHISICEFEHDAENKSLQITSRLFQDDLELNFNQSSGTSEYFTEIDEAKIKQDLKAFFQKSLQVTLDGKSRPPEFLGYEIEENVVWCYLEIRKVESIGEISISYTPLIDIFTDQINLVHIRYQGKVKSLKFYQSQQTGSAVFND